MAGLKPMPFYTHSQNTRVLSGLLCLHEGGIRPFLSAALLLLLLLLLLVC